jgi:hypothetical protein
VRGELNGRNVEGCMRAAILTGDGGDGGAAVESDEGEVVEMLRTVSGGQQEEGRARGRIGVVRGRVGSGDGRTVSGDGTLLKGVAVRKQWRGARARRKMARAASIGPQPVGAGGSVAALQWRAAGRVRRGREWLKGVSGHLRGPVGRVGVRGERGTDTRAWKDSAHGLT